MTRGNPRVLRIHRAMRSTYRCSQIISLARDRRSRHWYEARFAAGPALVFRQARIFFDFVERFALGDLFADTL